MVSVAFTVGAGGGDASATVFADDVITGNFPVVWSIKKSLES